MSVAERDLRWTEWIRRSKGELLEDLRQLENRWRSTMTARSRAERLRARWVMWALTNPDRQLRDQATHSLYWFGRGDAAALFELTLDGLAINDPYVPERLLAASYGVAMAHQFPDPEFANALADYVLGLRDTLTGATATQPTDHWLARLYAQGTIIMARRYYPDAVPKDLPGDKRLVFAPGPMVEPINENDPRRSEVDRALGFEFKDEYLESLTNRLALSMDYQQFQRAHDSVAAMIRGVIWGLGWRLRGLGAADESFIQRSSRRASDFNERYGTKYGRIGLYTCVGRLHEEETIGSGGERLPFIDLDPSFPESPQPATIKMPTWVRPTPRDDSRWLREATITAPDDVFYSFEIGPCQGPWIAAYCHLATDNQTPGRRVFGLFTALLVGSQDADRLVKKLMGHDRPSSNWLPEPASDYYTFAGEIPWHPEFAPDYAEDGPGQLGRFMIRSADEAPIEVEILAHRYAWEPHHSRLNQAGGALVPSRTFSAAFDLRGLPQSFDQAHPDGTVAAVSLGAPAGFDGHLLYLREDLVHKYAAGRRLVWFAWGERQVVYSYPPPEWLAKVRQAGEDVWRHVRKGEELSRAFAKS